MDKEDGLEVKPLEVAAPVADFDIDFKEEQEEEVIGLVKQVKVNNDIKYLFWNGKAWQGGQTKVGYHSTKTMQVARRKCFKQLGMPFRQISECFEMKYPFKGRRI